MKAIFKKTNTRKCIIYLKCEKCHSSCIKKKQTPCVCVCVCINTSVKTLVSICWSKPGLVLFPLWYSRSVSTFPSLRSREVFIYLNCGVGGASSNFRVRIVNISSISAADDQIFPSSSASQAKTHNNNGIILTAPQMNGVRTR